MEATKSNIIICTGFDVFKDFEDKNASWEAVKLLPDQISYKNNNFEIQKLKIPVEYAAVNQAVEQIWNLDPVVCTDYLFFIAFDKLKDAAGLVINYSATFLLQLVIHCGVKGRANTITLESCAINSGYCKLDYSNRCLNNDRLDLKLNGKNKDILKTNINIDKIANELNNHIVSNENCGFNVSANNQDVTKFKKLYSCSSDVGTYLCGYIYLKSLDHSLDRSMFIHVPNIDEPFSSEQTKASILKVILKCLEDLIEKNLV